MKKILKSRIFLVIITAIICTSLGVSATILYQADEIGFTPDDPNWNVNNLEDALNDLYTNQQSGGGTVCLYVSGTKGQIGSKYVCDPGDGIARNFYILKVNTNDVELIMERNLSDDIGNSATMTWQDAMDFFNEGHPGYTTKQSWTNVKNIDLPSAQEIADAGGITNFDVSTATNWSYFGVNSQSDTSRRTNYVWLYDYVIGCGVNGCNTSYGESDTSHAHGYWTKNLIHNDSASAWDVLKNGSLDYVGITSNSRGVRPVITINKSQLPN